MEYECTLSSAQNFAKNDKLEEWVHTYLLSDGHNKDFSDGLKLYDRYFLGPVKMPLSLLTRCCGPEENMKWRINEEWFEKHVNELSEVLKKETDMPPLIVHYLIENGKLTQPIKDINIIGNGPKALADITMVGNNYKMDNGTWTCGKDGQSCPVTCGMPSALVSKLTVGGEN